MLRLIRSLCQSISRAIRHDPEIERLLAAHPRVWRFLVQRLSPTEPLGLRLTVGVAVSLVFLFLFFATVEDLIARDPLVEVDLRIVSLVQIFRAPPFDNLMLFVTYLGNWQIVAAGASGLALFLVWSRQSLKAIALVVSIGVGESLVLVIKTLTDRPRPDLVNALAPAQGPSFPSGHAFVAFAFYGFVVWLAFDLAQRWSVKTLIGIVGILFIAALGFSRVYLGVHWPSDVLASYALGGAWLTAVITALTIANKLVAVDGSPPKTRRIGLVAGALFVAWTSVAAAFYVAHPLVRRDHIKPVPVELSATDFPENLLIASSRFSEDIAGKPMEPINIILVGSNGDLWKAFEEAGWEPTDQIAIGTAWRMLVAVLSNRPYPRAPGIPTFWHGRPNELGFERPTQASTARERHHLHLWDTAFEVSSTTVWVATVHRDKLAVTTAGIQLPVHEIDPVIDRERQALQANLLRTDCVERSYETTVTKPMMGYNAFGSPFFTDGKALVVLLKCK